MAAATRKPARLPAASHTVSELAQVRALANPRKLRILQAFAEAPTTTIEVAHELGEPVTALYRHVNALLRLKLIRVVSTRRKRGTVERTFQAVAKQFSVSEELFDSNSAPHPAVRKLFRLAEREFLDACPGGTPGAGNTGLAIGVRMTGSRAQAESFRMELLKLARRYSQARRNASDDGSSVTAAALLVYYEVKPPATAPKSRRKPRR